MNRDDILIDVTVHLIAAVSLLKKLHNDLPPSKKHALFNTMIADYEKAIDRAKAAK